MANPYRKSCLLKSYQTGRPTASTKVFLRRDGSNYPGCALYRVLTDKNGKIEGAVSYTIRIDQLIFTAIPQLSKDGIYAAVFDLDAPNIDYGYIVNTQTLYGNGTLMSAAQNNVSLMNAFYTVEGMFPFVDRSYRIVLYPGPVFIEKFSPTGIKWIALGGSWITTGFLLGLVAILFLSLRVLHARRLQRQATLAKLAEMKENQKKLRFLLNKIATQEQTTRATINAIDDIVIVIGTTGKILQTNTSFDKMFKYTVSELERGVYTKNLFVHLPDLFFISMTDIMIDTKIKLRFGNEEPIEIIVKYLQSEQTVQSHQNLVEEIELDEGEDARSYVIVGHLKRKLIPSSSTRSSSISVPFLEFDRNFRNEQFRKDLLEFSRTRRNEENVLFLIRVLKYRKSDFHERVELSQNICDTFLVEDAPRQLNLSGERREAELKRIAKNVGDIDVFSSLEDTVKRVLMEQVYTSFMEQRENNTNHIDSTINTT
jgi:PAS domain-containing protein